MQPATLHKHRFPTECNHPYPEDMPPYPMDGEMPDGGAPLPLEAAEYVSYIPQEGKEGQEFYKYERLILQMVVRYGEKNIVQRSR